MARLRVRVRILGSHALPAIRHSLATRRMIAVSLVLEILCDVEGLAMSLILPVWRKDVKTIAHALAIRRTELGAR